jgi:uncharacterized protein
MPRPLTFIVPFFILAFCGIAQAALSWENLDLKSPVNDYAGLLNANERASLAGKLNDYNRATGNALVLVAISDLGGGDIDDAATRIFSKAGIGQKDKNNGALLLIAVNDHLMRIEVGYGLEPTLTDAQCANIIRRDLTPAFRAGRYYAGIDAAFSNMEKIIGGEEVPAPPRNDNRQFSPFALLFFGVPLVAFIIGLFHKKPPTNGRGSGYRGFGPGGFGGSGFSGGFGGGGGGGFGGFGGGMSGGGGAHGGW